MSRILIILITSIFTTVLILILYKECSLNIEDMVDILPIKGKVRWKRANQCNYKMGATLKKILKENNIKQTTSEDWTIYIPCTYNSITKEINKIKPTKKEQRVFVVNNADQLAGKNMIWENIAKSYGNEVASQLMPRTYILNKEADMTRFKKEYNNNNIYILKKNIQRQKGLQITKNKNEILEAKEKGYVIVQEILQHPYCVDGRKINMRFYLLLVCQKNEISAYVHKEGFMYYTRVKYKEGNMDKENIITTGYIEREVYEKNPLTHGDFRKYLDDGNRKLNDKELKIVCEEKKISDVVFDAIYELLKVIIIAVKHIACVGSHIQESLSFQLFGADIAINKQLKPQLMEINKGPDMGAKDERDNEIKYNVMTDVFKVLQAIPKNDHEFIKLI